MSRKFCATVCTPMTWSEANDFCTSLDAYLAEILNKETQDLLAGHAATLDPQNWWLGASDQATVRIRFRPLLCTSYILINLKMYSAILLTLLARDFSSCLFRRLS